MKQSVWTAGKIYEEVDKLRTEFDELKKALELIDDEIGRTNAAYRLILQQKEQKFRELQEFEKQKFTLGTSAPAVNLDNFMADTPASRPF
jgi:hypothetical protein